MEDEKEIVKEEKEIAKDENINKEPEKKCDDKNKEIGNNKIVALLILTIILSLICGFTGAFFVIKTNNTDSTNITKKSITVEESNSIADAVEKVYDAVVVVETYQKQQLYSTGTGFIYKTENDKAYIMTNNHVIDGGESIKVLFNDGEEKEASIIGTDTYSDIAVLSIEKNDKIKVATIGKTSDIKVGDTVFTVGSPEGANYAGTVTKGILSGKDRLVEVALTNKQTSDYYMSVLQTDAAINPGNSGGPICNINGEVIGITNMKLVDDSVEGMGFAIPIEDAIKVSDLLEKNDKIERPYIGISMLDLNNSYYLWQAGIMIPNNVKEGVVVYGVEDNSPASASGLKKGDIIISISNKKVSSVADFRYQLYKHQPGDTVEMKIYRDGKEQTVKITLTTKSS